MDMHEVQKQLGKEADKYEMHRLANQQNYPPRSTKNIGFNIFGYFFVAWLILMGVGIVFGGISHVYQEMVNPTEPAYNEYNSNPDSSWSD